LFHRFMSRRASLPARLGPRTSVTVKRLSRVRLQATKNSSISCRRSVHFGSADLMCSEANMRHAREANPAPARAGRALPGPS
jgi:hypothetical protein